MPLLGVPCGKHQRAGVLEGGGNLTRIDDAAVDDPGARFDARPPLVLAGAEDLERPRLGRRSSGANSFPRLKQDVDPLHRFGPSDEDEAHGRAGSAGLTLRDRTRPVAGYLRSAPPGEHLHLSRARVGLDDEALRGAQEPPRDPAPGTPGVVHRGQGMTAEEAERRGDAERLRDEGDEQTPRAHAAGGAEEHHAFRRTQPGQRADDLAKRGSSIDGARRVPIGLGADRNVDMVDGGLRVVA